MIKKLLKVIDQFCTLDENTVIIGWTTCRSLKSYVREKQSECSYGIQVDLKIHMLSG